MDKIEERIEDAAGAAQVPYPSPETVIADALKKLDPTWLTKRQRAHFITKALRCAGWRILRQ